MKTILLCLCFATLSQVRAVTYQFTNIADSNGIYGTTFTSPAISSDGTAVAFSATLDAGGSGVFLVRDGNTTTVASTSGGVFSAFTEVAVNNSGTVAFSANLVGGGMGVYSGSGGALKTLAVSTGPFSAFSPPSINDSGTVAVVAHLDGGGDQVLTITPAGAQTNIASIEGNGLSSATDLSGASINASGAVVFLATTGDVSRIMYKPAGSSAAGTIISNGTNDGDFFGLCPPTISATGRIDFLSGRYAAQVAPIGQVYGAFTFEVGTGVVTTLGSVNQNNLHLSPHFLEAVALTNSVGQFVYWDGNEFELGIRNGPTASDRVLAFGDALFGSTVGRVYISRRSLDESGRVAFRYTLADGRKGVALSEPPIPTVKTGDFLIKEASEPDSAFGVDGGFFPIPLGRQDRKVSFEPQIGSSGVFTVDFQNDKDQDETYILTGVEAGDTGWTVEAKLAGVDQWAIIRGAGFNTGVMTPGAKLRFTVTVRGTNQAAALPYGTKHEFTMYATTEGNTSLSQDTIKATAESVEATIVNSTGDEPDADANDGRADTDLQKPGQQVTLRAAIQFANAHPGKDIIKFAIPADDPGIVAGVPRIQPATPLPEITDSVNLDGWSQNTNATTPPIELSGDTISAAAPAPVTHYDLSLADRLLAADGLTSGLVVSASDCEIRGFAINHFPLTGLDLNGPNNTVQGVFFGIDATGTIPKANGTFNQGGLGSFIINRDYRELRGCGLAITSSGNLIGGTSARDRNLFSGAGGVFYGGQQFDSASYGLATTAPGIAIQGPQATGNRIVGNYFGLAPNGVDAVLAPSPFAPGRQFQPAAGVAINRASNNTIGGVTAGEANYFVNQNEAVSIRGLGVTGNRVIGNVIGLNSNRALSAGATLGAGVVVVDGPGRNDIGGYNAGEGNLVAVASTLILVRGSVGVVVAGNQLGLAAPGPRGATDAMEIAGTSTVVENNTIPQCERSGILVTGTDTLVRNNTISGGAFYTAGYGGGIWLFHGDGNRIYDNVVQGHGLRGISIENECKNNQIIGNHLHHNPGSGIVLRGGPYLFDAQPVQNKISQNLIHDNGGLAISFGDGKTPTPNAEIRAFSGPNLLRNHPVIGTFPDHCRLNGTTLTVTGTLTSVASTTFRVEFFASPHASPSGIGEGERYLGAQDVTTNFAGTANFTFTANNVAQVGEYISATATDPAGNTSEFSEARSVHGEAFTFSNKLLSDEEQQGVPNRAVPAPLAPRVAALAPGLGDGNGDGTPDFQQANVASLIGIAGEWLTLAAPTGVALENIVPTGPPAFDHLPRGYTFPLGFLSFKATGVEAGKSVAIKEIFHRAVAFSTVFAFGPTPDKPQPHWYEFLFDGKTGGAIGADEIAFTFTDGQRGDHDLKADGTITTILAPAYLPPTAAAAMTSAHVPGEPADTKFAAFAPPHSGPFAGTMLVGKKKVAAIFAADGSVRAKVGGAMPGLSGVAFAKLGQPSGDATLATLAGNGITAANDEVLLAGLRGGPVRLAAREGQLTDIAGVFIKKFGTIDGNGTAIFFLATLQGDGITPKNNHALCSAPGDGSVHVLVLKNQLVNNQPVTTIGTLVGVPGTLAEGRWRMGDFLAGVRLSFANKSSGIFAIPAIPSAAVPWTLWASTGPGATANDPVLASLGLPGFGSDGPAFIAQYKTGVGGILAGNDTLLYRGGSGGYDQLAREGTAAPGIAVPQGAPPATFKTIADPVCGIAGRTAFAATLAGVKANVAACIFYSPDPAREFLLARAGDPAPGGGKFASFTSLAFPDGSGSGPIFTAELLNDKAIGVSAANNFGLWAADASGALGLVLRTGQPLNVGGTTRIVKSFSALVPAAGSIGSAHGYDNAGHISALITFTDRGTALIEFNVP
ncbi:MAG: choice-of-anchor tandem repeat NxxGxxAF-containing protein [Chthoniobacteraceae bacterium]